MSAWNRLPARRRRALTIQAADRDGWICHLCKKPIDPYDRVSEWKLSADHVVTVRSGGKHSLENLKPAHLRCNKQRGARAVTTVAFIDNLAAFFK